jgi:hypothetical protein
MRFESKWGGGSKRRRKKRGGKRKTEGMIPKDLT